MSKLEKVSEEDVDGTRIYIYRRHIPKMNSNGELEDKVVTIKRQYVPSLALNERRSEARDIIAEMPPLTTPRERYRFYLERAQLRPFTSASFEALYKRSISHTQEV